MSEIKLYNEDCLPAMRKMKDDQFDLAIVDPPYGININMNMGRRKNEKLKYKNKKWDKQTPTKEYFNELLRISKNQIIWGGNYFNLPLVRGWIFWDKNVPEGVSFADGELAWTSFNVVLRKIDIPYSGFTGKDKDIRIHPTQKPVKLYKRLLDKYAKKGDKILDTHLGSGSIAIACWDLGFDLTGYEIDKEYFDGAIKRLTIFQKQTKLF